MIMSEFYQILHSGLTHRIGWMLIHSLWQGVLIAFALGVANLSLRGKSSQARYLAACLALACQVLLMVVTFLLLQGSYEPTPSLTSEPVSVQQVNSVPPVVPASKSPSFLMPAERELSSSFNILEPLVPWTVCIWSCGILILTIWNLGTSILLHRLKCLTTRSVDKLLERKLTQLLTRMQINQRVQLLQSSIANSPMVIGIIKPVVLFPTSLLTQLSPEQIEAILIHELAHICRHDFLVNLIQVATETLLFYHPATWWISSQIRAERENCCDDIVIEISHKRDIYVTALAAIAEQQVTLAPAASGAPLLPRIQRLLNCTTNQRQPWFVEFSVFALVVFVFLAINVPTERLNAQVVSNPAVKSPLATPSPVPLDPKVHDALAATIAFYASKNSMEYDAVTTISTFNEPKNFSFKETSHSVFRRPYSFSIVVPPETGDLSATLISDGEKMVNYDPSEHTYSIQKPFDIETLVGSSDLMGVWASPSVVGLGIFFCKDFLTACCGNSTSSQDLAWNN
jgi:beta-lactamase regulating signal transducer with metallopeptidase domain